MFTKGNGRMMLHTLFTISLIAPSYLNSSTANTMRNF
ncbi:hypothetical protein Golob_014332 [Gossypium lobatum]|uniref:Uncharacterized protein n=1 Tax=Gossypium lobatum TaxID=34289 RepID=A0A7J8LXT7_9ROSI|nr:hypothetical protein [Gossypium lobatum]